MDRIRPFILLAAVLGGHLALEITVAPPAGAAAFTVTTNLDVDDGGDGLLSLREAVDGAQNAGEDSTITIPAGLGQITLTAGQLNYGASHHLTINGNGATISGNDASRIFNFTSNLSTITLDDLTLRDGMAAGDGGAVAVAAVDPVTFTDVTFLDNHATGGGGAVVGRNMTFTDSHFGVNAADGTGSADAVGGAILGGNVTITGSTFETNGDPDMPGGAVAVELSLEVSTSTFTDNTAGAGGAIYLANGATLDVTTSTFTGNSGIGTDGGAIHAQASVSVAIDRSTFTANTSGMGGGAIVADNPTIRNSTFTENVATGVQGPARGGAIRARNQATLTHVTSVANEIQGIGQIGNGGAHVWAENALSVEASVFREPVGDGAVLCVVNMLNGLQSLGHNLGDDASCGDAPTDFLASAELEPLADNGGPTFTRAPSHRSNLIDRIPAGDCALASDQRGITRPRGGACDIGAVEDVPPPPCGGRAVTVDLAEGDGPTAGADVIRGTAGGDVINGLGGDDTICGGGGDDTVSGGTGNDRLFGENGVDTLRGQTGADTIYGGAQRDVAYGGGGNDRLFGQSGNDALLGETGEDFLDGGTGTDALSGGPQRDTCRGGPQRDTHVGCEIQAGIP